MSPGDLSIRTLCTGAATLSAYDVEIMAHALGWPETGRARPGTGRVRWSNPYRNVYAADHGSAAFAAWMLLAGMELAKRDNHVGDLVYFHVTDLGIAVLRAHIAVMAAVGPWLRRDTWPWAEEP